MAPTAAVASIRVLIVDDNPAIHRDFEKVLRAADRDLALDDLEAELFGCDDQPDEPPLRLQIDHAYQGEEAIARVAEAAAAEAAYAVAFVDVRMPPGIDGIETIARMWRLDPRVQVVICSAYSDCSWEEMTRKLGAPDRFLVLRKPFDSVEVLQLVHALGRKWRLALEVEQQVAVLEATVSARTRELEGVNAQLREEIAARRQAAVELERMATHDALTGLPNRLLMSDRIVAAMARAQRSRAYVGLMLLDLDQFKEINDTNGHVAGDAVLCEMAARLKSTVREADTVARMGGDEFVIVLEDIAQPEDLALVARRIIDRCSEPMMVSGHRVASPPSVGIVLFPDDAADPETLLKCADLAMYRAKTEGGRCYRFFNPEMLDSAVKRVTLREELAQAFEHGQFELHYQPLHALDDGGVTGMEALLRWNHPERGLVAPMSFIPETERSGLIVPLGRWVLKTACRQLAAWNQATGQALSVAVNVSARQLRDPHLLASVRAALSEAGLSPGLLELELTESAAFEDVTLAKEVLAGIADLGVRILIDDFGSGYSSLDRIRSLPVHGLKIDRFFLRDVESDPRSAAMFMAMVVMARSLGIEVVAEGIETDAQLAFLRTMSWPTMAPPRCDRVQGFLLGRPVPAEELTRLLVAGRATPSQAAPPQPDSSTTVVPPSAERVGSRPSQIATTSRLVQVCKVGASVR